MGEWQAWHPTVSRQSRSTDITDGFGPGTRWSAGPESYIDEVVAASPGLLLAASLVFRVPSGPPARSPSAPRAYGSARRLEARPGPAVPTAPSPLVARVCRGRPGPAAALRHRGCGCVTGSHLAHESVVAASPMFWVPSGPPARSPSALRACGSARRLEARPGPAVPPAPSTLPCGPDGTLHTGGAGASRAARPERGGSTASAQNYRAHDGVCEKCDGLNVSEPTEHSTIARGVHAVE